MLKRIGTLRALRRGLVTFWALWWTTVVLSNTADVLKVFGVLPEDFAWVSNNFALLRGAEGIAEGIPVHVMGLYLFGIAYEALVATTFWRATLGFRGGGEPRELWRAAFTMATALWCAFLLLCELTVTHAGPPFYMAMLTTVLVTFLAVERLGVDD